ANGFVSSDFPLARSARLSFRDFLAFLACFRQTDCDGLLAALDLAAFAAAAAASATALVAMHFAFHVLACATRISALSLCHDILQNFLRRTCFFALRD